MKGDFHVRFCENVRVKLPYVTRLVAIRPEKDLGNGFIGFQPKTTSSSQSYLSSRSAKRLLQAEGEGK
jgi:hypothetical protein